MFQDSTLSLAWDGAHRRVTLSAYLEPEAEERAAVAAIRWIKALRLARVDGATMRERFRYRDDSLWWFAELYLHKQRAILGLFRTIEAAGELFERETPASIIFEQGDALARLILPQLARARGVAYEGPSARPAPWARAGMDARSTALMAGSLASPERPSRGPRSARTTVAGFVHRAFWRERGTDGSAESYIGPVLERLEARLPGDGLRLVGIGPRMNFRARRWWRRGPAPPARMSSIESLTPRAALAGSAGIWAARHAMRRALESSADIRQSALIGTCDCWSLIAGELAGIALLQFPWSARAMDEASAALDALEPSVAVTYAEAGGWGRALAMEARRRSIPLAGLQHGFIYRHWLNYLHEPDEMEPLGSDQGFPRPTLTLLFDEYAAEHLRAAGRFPPDALTVTGSPRLDQLARTFRDIDGATIEAARSSAGAGGSTPLLLLATKYAEVRRVFGALLDAVRLMPDVQLAIKTHPAEVPEAYAAAATLPNARVLPASAPLAPLLRACQAVVTVNSTVALDAVALGLPAVTIGLPNNLSPFVEAGALAGARDGAEIRETLRRVVYDDEFRRRLAARAAALVGTWGMKADGAAAERAADAVLTLARTGASRRSQE